MRNDKCPSCGFNTSSTWSGGVLKRYCLSIDCQWSCEHDIGERRKEDKEIDFPDRRFA